MPPPNRRQLLRVFWTNAFWLYPALGMVASLIVAPFLRWVDRETQWQLFGATPEGARTLLAALSSSMLTFMVFVVTSLLVVVQLASAQLTPRIISLTFQRGAARWVLTLFTVAFTYTVGTSSRIENDSVPQLPLAVAVFLNLASIVVFLYFAHRLAVGLRPVSVLTGVAGQGRRVVETMYPLRFDVAAPEQADVKASLAKHSRTVSYERGSGAILSVDLRAIGEEARRANAVVEVLPQVGDFITRGDPLFRVAPTSAALNDAEIRAGVVVGSERTIEQDPRFVFRIIVDIANKALSPAINDPTTAVLAVDQVHRLLLLVGSRHLDEGTVRDGAGNVRVLYGTPDWDDYVTLGISEIRHYGTGSIQVARRLRAMLEHLLQSLPARRHAALARELVLLRRSVERGFPDEEDRLRAAVGDSQGTGGSELAEALPSSESAEKKD